MTDEALQPTGTTGSEEPLPHHGLDNEAQDHLALFAAVLLGRARSEPEVSSVVLRARSEAAEALASGRQPLTRQRSLPFTLLYRACKSDAAAIRPLREIAEGGDAADRAFAALATLRHRQRSVLALRYIAGLEEAEVAEVIGVRPADLAAIIGSASTAIARAMGSPVDLPGALARARTRLAPRIPVPESIPATVGRLPRPVVRALIQSPAKPTPPRNASRRHRLLLAASLVLIVVATLVPALARVTRPASIGLHPAPVLPAQVITAKAPPAKVAAVRQITVAPGDSLWLIAQRTLGNPERWTQIWVANRGRSMPGGERFTNPDLIRPGWRLTLR